MKINESRISDERLQELIKIGEGFGGSDCTQALRELRRAQNWISTKDKLPEINGDVLVWREQSASARTALYSTDEDSMANGFLNHAKFPMPIMADVTHWQPLPPLREETPNETER